MKISTRVEKIFAHAVALQQSGKLRNAIYCQNSSIYILNQDNTIIMKFPLRQREGKFIPSFCFNANDYDSNLLKINEDGKVVFIQYCDEFVREKRCNLPVVPLKIVRKTYKSRMKDISIKNTVILTTEFIKCLQDDLSHIEFSSSKGKFKAIQKHIYTGTFITITKKDDKMSLGLTTKGKLKSFEPIGIRTNDLIALFSFVHSVKFHFGNENVLWFESNDARMPFKGVLSHCKYDELGSE